MTTASKLVTFSSGKIIWRIWFWVIFHSYVIFQYLLLPAETTAVLFSASSDVFFLLTQ